MQHSLKFEFTFYTQYTNDFQQVNLINYIPINIVRYDAFLVKKSRVIRKNDKKRRMSSQSFFCWNFPNSFPTNTKELYAQTFGQ